MHVISVKLIYKGVFRVIEHKSNFWGCSKGFGWSKHGKVGVDVDPVALVCNRPEAAGVCAEINWYIKCNNLGGFWTI